MAELVAVGGRDKASGNGNVKSWRTKDETVQEKAHKEMLRLVVTRLQQRLSAQNVESALIGGTALRLVDKLPRPSKDIDLKVSRHVPRGEALAVETVNTLPGWNARRATIREYARGVRGIVVTNETTGVVTSTEVELLEGAVNSRDSEGVNPGWLVVSNGIKTYPIDILARLKLATLIGDRPRKESKDVVDAVWLMEEHGHLIVREDREALKVWTARNQHNREARERFEESGRGSWNEAMEDLDRAIDESVRIVDQAEQLTRVVQEVHRQSGSAALNSEVDRTGRMNVKIIDAEGHGTPFGHVRSTKVLALAIAATGGLKTHEIPEIVRELEKEREKQHALANAKMR